MTRRKCSGKKYTSERLAASDKIALVGAGGVATSLGVALAQAAAAPVAVWSRTREKALALAERTGALACSEIEEIPQVDIVIISVADDAIGSVARRVAAHLPAALILHTAGSVAQDILREAGAVNYGVLYPMQTFSSSRIVDFTKVTVFVEACNELLDGCCILNINLAHNKSADCLDMLSHILIKHRNDNLLKWLANLDIHLTAQCQHHRRCALC